MPENAALYKSHKEDNVIKSIDWADSENYRNKLVAQLMEYCTELGLSTTAEGDTFTITLPTVQDINIWSDSKKRKVFDTSLWGPTGIDENEITNLPENGEILDEGIPPQGDKDAEK